MFVDAWTSNHPSQSITWARARSHQPLSTFSCVRLLESQRAVQKASSDCRHANPAGLEGTRQQSRDRGAGQLALISTSSMKSDSSTAASICATGTNTRDSCIGGGYLSAAIPTRQPVPHQQSRNTAGSEASRCALIVLPRPGGRFS